MYSLIVVNTLLLLTITRATPIGNFSANATINGNASNASSSNHSDNHAYCQNAPISSPSIIHLHNELSNVIDLLEPACPNATFKRNVSTSSEVASYVVYLFIM